jgi:capsule biosynthesis phosphatase
MRSNRPCIVIDIDDTICDNKNRDYVNAIPHMDVINKINNLYEEKNYDIVLYTARGMVSCNGDLKAIDKKNRVILEEWLKKHNVKYTRLMFGKPLGDLYVDDKGMNVKEFKNATFGKIHSGGSGKDIERIGSFVKKDLGTREETLNFQKWIDYNNGSCKYPHVISYLYNGVYMDYIEGINLCDDFVMNDFVSVVSTIFRFATNTKYNSEHHTFIMDGHIQNTYENLTPRIRSNIRWDAKVYKCVKMLKSIKNEMKDFVSYSHGDLTLSNIIKTRDKELYFLDARFNENASSYLLDFAKLRMSIGGYEKIFGISERDNSEFVEYLDIILKHLGILEKVLIFEYMYIIRLYRYKNMNDKEKVMKMISDLEAEHEEFFSRY